MRVLLAPLLAACVAIVACSGRVAPETTSFGAEGALLDAGGSAPTIEQVDATANGHEEVGARPPPDPKAMEAACEAIVDATCSGDTETCCVSKGVTWDEAGCRAKARAACEDILTRVASGARGLDPSKLPACVAGWHSIATKCTVAKTDALTVLVSCDLVFPSISATTTCGVAPCTTDADCPSSSGVLRSCGYPHCGGIVFGAGATVHSRNFCGLGPCVPGEARCSANPGAGGFEDRCAPTLNVGSSCGWSVDGCCDFGLRCVGGGLSTGYCAAGLADGEPCVFNEECASTSCWGGVCAPRPVGDPSPVFATIASPVLCSGADGSYVPLH